MSANAKSPRWNYNIHHHAFVLRAVPAHAETAIDVGSGDGLLALELADRGLDVIGIDIDPSSIERATQSAGERDNLEFRRANVLTFDPGEQRFDLVASISTLHHVSAERGLIAMRDLVAPRGVLAVVGFGRPSTAADHARSAAGAAYKQWRRTRGHYWEHNAPTSWPPPESMQSMAELTERLLPGASFRRLVPGRFGIVWTRPDGQGAEQ